MWPLACVVWTSAVPDSGSPSASRQPARGRVNHDAHLAGALAGVLFVLITDVAAFGRAWQHLMG